MDPIFALFDPAFAKIVDLFAVEAEDLSEIFQQHQIGPNKVHSSELPRRDAAADQLLTGARVWSGVEGTSLGLGGVILLVPNLFGLLRTLLRTVQSMAWAYDAKPNTDEEKRQIWKLVIQGITKTPANNTSSNILSGSVAQMLIRKASENILSSLGMNKTQQLSRKLLPIMGALAQGFSNAAITAEVGSIAKQHYREQFLTRFTIE
jgi:hypothetical protein